MADTDVLVVGAGPSGSTAAIALRVAGVARVMVLDAARFPRPKPCGGVIARRGIDALRELGVPLRVANVPLSGAEIRGGRFRVAVAPGRAGAIGVVVRREEFDASLVHAARARGADVREGVRVLEIGPFVNGMRLVRTSTGEIAVRRVLGADGATSRVSKTIRAERGGPKPAFAAATEALTHAGADDPAPGHMRYDFSLRGAPGNAAAPGYAWDFPSPSGRSDAGFNRGVYTLHPKSLRGSVPRELDAFLTIRAATRAEAPQSWPERLYDERRPLSAPGVFLAGEAIGVNAVTGEGIAPAIESARFAARWTAASLADTSGPGAWEPYTYAFRRSILGRRLSFGNRLARLLYGPRGRFFRDLGIADAEFQRLLLEDFAGDIDVPHWKRWLMVRLATDVVLQMARETLRP